MAFSSGSKLNGTTSGNETSQGSTAWSFTTGGSVPAGSLIVVVVAMDNLATTDGNSSSVTGVSDTEKNQWTKAGEFTNTVGGAAGDGACVAVWYSILTTAITSGSSTITTTYGSNVTAKCCFVINFPKESSSGIAIGGTVQTLANDNADAGSMSLSSLPIREYLFLRAIASETDTNAIASVTASYTGLSAQSGTGGSEKNHQAIAVEYLIATGTGSTSDPTMSDTTADRASLFMAFYEIPKIPNGLLSVKQAVNRGASF